MNAEQERYWRQFEAALDSVKLMADLCIASAKHDGRVGIEAMRARLLRAAWELVAAIRFNLLRADIKASPVNETDLKLTAEELLATLRQ